MSSNSLVVLGSCVLLFIINHIFLVQRAYIPLWWAMKVFFFFGVFVFLEFADLACQCC